MNQKIVLLRKDKRYLDLIEMAQEIVIKCRRYNHENIPDFIVNYAELKRAI